MYHEAEKTLQDAIKQMPTNPLFYYSLGVLMGRLNRLEVSWNGLVHKLMNYITIKFLLQEGKELLSKAVSMDATSAGYHANLGWHCKTSIFVT